MIAAVLLLGWAMYPAIQVQYQATRQYEGLQAEYRGLSERNAVLRAEVADLKTPEGVERAARESLGFAKRGENVYVVIPPGTDPAAPAADTTAAAEADALMTQGQPDPMTAMLDLLFGIDR